jgi:hypothetical protein
VVVVDASGRRGAGEAVRLALVHRGWSVITEASASPAPRSRIVYADNDQHFAAALARTLTFKTDLENCGRACQGVQLVLGANAARHGPPGAPPARQRG